MTASRADQPQAGVPAPWELNKTLSENIAALAERRRREEANAPAADRIAGRIATFAGSMSFVAIHLLLFGAWVLVNIGGLPGVRPFDPSLVTLATIASVEAIFLSTFVLINQNRAAAAADRRADLDLQVTLLTEHELSRLAALTERIADRLSVPTNRAELAEIERDIRPEAVLDALENAAPGD